MQHKKLFIMPVIAGVLIVIASGIALAFTQPAHAAQCGSQASSVLAQCGSQISSCKNCHEVQEKKPVNTDGTPWHTSHAFGDFCYICHGGNQQATDETLAHSGMVDPLSDIKASCQSCHPSDYQTKAQVYATKLGVQIGIRFRICRFRVKQRNACRDCNCIRRARFKQYICHTSTRRTTTIRLVPQ